MKSLELLEAIGDAQDDYILDAKKPGKKQIPVWMKWTAMAACLCLIVGMVWFFKTPNYPNAAYTAQDLANLFPRTLESNSTNAYTKVYVPSGEYLQLNPILEADTLPIYRYDYSRSATVSQQRVNAFIEKTLSNYCAALGIAVPEYTLSADDSYRIVTPDEYYRFHAFSNALCTSFSLSVTYKTDDPTIYLNGHAVQVDQRRTDEEILASIEGVKSQLFDIYGVSFSDAKVFRYYDGYSDYGVGSLTVYYFDEDAHPLNAYSACPVSDYIEIRFDNMRNFEGDIVSDAILSSAEIRYCNYNKDSEDFYPQIANGNMISLAEAEKLLYKGYVFGGHSCPLCMAAQEKISFEDYDYVGLTYVFGYTGEGKQRDVVPFYTFYKAIGTSENGNIIYAQTYVPAIEVSGLDAYFQDQRQSHDS